MKFGLNDQDCLYGIIQGIFIIGLSGIYFSVDKISAIKIFPMAIFSIGLLLTILNFFQNIVKITKHFKVSIAAMTTNLINIVIEFSFISWITGWNIPLVSNYVHFLDNPQIVLYLGVWVLASSAIWLIIWHFIE